MGPDLTNTASNPKKGKEYMRTYIQSGTNKMPNFHLSPTEVNELIAFLVWVDKSGKSMVPDSAVNWMGNYKIEQSQ